MVNQSMEASKKITGILVGAAMLSGLATPFSLVLAESHPEISPTPHAGFCANIEKHAGTIDQKIKDLDAKLDAKRSDHQAKLEAKRSDFKSKATSRRDTHDAKHEEIFAKVREAAQTDEQKAAVEKFVSTVQAAVDARQAAVNNALNAHKAGIDREFNARWSEIDTAHAALKAARDAAFAKAREDCANGVDNKTVRTNLHADLKAAREVFRDTAKRTGAHHDAAKQHQQTLKDAVHKAVEDYKATVAGARDELKTALGQ